MTTNCTIAYPHSHLDTHTTYNGPHHRVLDTADLARQFRQEHGRDPKFGELRAYPGMNGLTTDALREVVDV